MKYWNKDKHIRQQHWHRIERPVHRDWNYNNTKRYLQLIDSPGKFYMYYGSTTIWFERESDAVWFSIARPSAQPQFDK